MIIERGEQASANNARFPFLKEAQQVVARGYPRQEMPGSRRKSAEATWRRGEAALDAGIALVSLGYRLERAGVLIACLLGRIGKSQGLDLIEAVIKTR